MLRNLFIAAITMLSLSAQADTYEEMYKNSFMAYCLDGICNDAKTGELVKAENIQLYYTGWVILFDKPYTQQEIQEATPYITKRYQEEQQ